MHVMARADEISTIDDVVNNVDGFMTDGRIG